ncbi:MAG: PAQR family membrane homeostasis protein TrhA [Acutalibacteraceae bacterium]|jgi:hemolysin III
MKKKEENTKFSQRISEEEIFNSSSHIIGCWFAIIAFAGCIIVATINQNLWGVISGAIYGTTLLFLYTVSSVYHALPETNMSKKIFRIIDRCSIFLFIAGTYTPIALCAVRKVDKTLAWTIFGVVWALAILGVILNSININKFRMFSLICYVAMGWCILVAIRPILQVVDPRSIWYLFFGGFLYSIGAILYLIGKRTRYMHLTFHMFVLAGSILHFIFILYLL